MGHDCVEVHERLDASRAGGEEEVVELGVAVDREAADAPRLHPLEERDAERLLRAHEVDPGTELGVVHAPAVLGLLEMDEEVLLGAVANRGIGRDEVAGLARASGSPARTERS